MPVTTPTTKKNSGKPNVPAAAPKPANKPVTRKKASRPKAAAPRPSPVVEASLAEPAAAVVCVAGLFYEFANGDLKKVGECLGQDAKETTLLLWHDGKPDEASNFLTKHYDVREISRELCYDLSIAHNW